MLNPQWLLCLVHFCQFFLYCNFHFSPVFSDNYNFHFSSILSDNYKFHFSADFSHYCIFHFPSVLSDNFHFHFSGAKGRVLLETLQRLRAALQFCQRLSKKIRIIEIWNFNLNKSLFLILYFHQHIWHAVKVKQFRLSAREGKANVPYQRIKWWRWTRVLVFFYLFWWWWTRVLIFFICFDYDEPGSWSVLRQSAC